MSAFVATNIEYDNVSEASVDNTKELQIEEALKLYQDALKLHAEGPTSYDETAKAYAALFNSEIFKWSESLTDYRRSEIDGDLGDEEDLALGLQTSLGPQLLVSTTDLAPNTLPQILHLAYKNHGLFLLQVLQHKIRQSSASNGAEGQSGTVSTAHESLDCFAQALDKDDADTDLWRSSAAVAAIAGSTRVSRFCLEAILDGDDDGLEGVLSLPSIDESYATQKLQQLTTQLKDDLAARSPRSNKTRQLAPRLVQRLEPFPTIPRPSFNTSTYSQSSISGVKFGRRVVQAPRRDWAAVGEIIVSQLTLTDSLEAELGPGAAIRLELPPLVTKSPPPIEIALPQALDFVASEVSRSAAIEDKPSVAPHADGTEMETDTGAIPEPSAAEEVTEISVEQELPLLVGTDQLLAPGDATNAPDDPAQARKRSTDEADLREQPEGARLRSKRNKRGRDTLDGQTAEVIDPATQFQQAMQQWSDADEWLFETIQQVFNPIGAEGIGTSHSLRQIATADAVEPSRDQEPLSTAIQDLFEICQNCSPERAKVFANSDSLDVLASRPIEHGLQSIRARQTGSSTNPKSDPTPSAQGLESWLEAVNTAWTYQNDLAWEWLLVFLMPGRAPGTMQQGASSYTIHAWTEELKRNVVQVMVRDDEYITTRVQDGLTAIERSMLEIRANDEDEISLPEPADLALIEVAQTIFELHLDVYKRFKHPSSGIDPIALNAQRYRLERWSSIAHTAINLHSTKSPDLREDQLAIRHIWAVAFQISSLDDVSQSHVSAVMKDLRSLLLSLDGAPIFLQNNAVMPEVSVAAIDQELNDINMQKFFQKVFSYNQNNPIAVIDSLEPILEVQIEEDRQSRKTADTHDGPDGDVEMQMTPAVDPSISLDGAGSPVVEVSRFLAKGDALLRLSLWQRLRQAFQAIVYAPKVVYCHLQSINMLIAELASPAYREQDKIARAVPLLRYLALIDELLKYTIEAQKARSDAFEFVGTDLLQQTISSLQSLARLLTTFNIYEDCVRIKQLPEPYQDGKVKQAFSTISNKMYGLQVRNWVLQYALLMEAIEQRPEAFTSAKTDRFNFIRAVHHNMGSRGICNRADKALLKLARDELVQLSDLDDFEGELSQVLSDLYGLKCINPALLHDHRCADVESITRTRAIQLIGFVMAQAHKVPAKDLHKSDIKLAIDKIHGFLHMLKPKSASDIIVNRRVFKAYIDSPINPVNILSSLRGTFELPIRRVSAAQAPVASTGWYALMANISLGKFKFSRRNAPGSTEDLITAIDFFKQDLEYSAEKWETWYNLAQCYDLQLEECVSWTAEKLNSQHLAQPKDTFPEIVQYQRSAIHCYAVAVSTIVRADVENQDMKKIADVYYDFALRLYASSREPFAMQVFAFRETEERFFSGNSLYKRTPFQATKILQAYRMTIIMLKRSISLMPDNWHAHFLLAKVLWKAYQIDKSDKVPKSKDIIEAAIGAIEALPEKDRSGGKAKDPVLEPHYKLVTLVNKLFAKDAISFAEGIKALKCSYYGRKISDELNDPTEWVATILSVISELQAADKANWQHRIITRAARILQKSRMDPEKPNMGAQAAKDELTQNMFTKTMTLQVWRPDNERPGRHFVYTTRYLRYFFHLLIKLEDRPNLELLIRRLRRKQHEFLSHARLWEAVVLDYLKLLRKVAGVPSGHEEATFKSMNHEDFTTNSELLETWAHSATAESVILDVLKEATELKRLNMGLMKHTLIDDLICDTYARLFEVVVPNLTPPPPKSTTEDVGAPSAKVDLSGQIGNQTTTSSTGAATATDPPNTAVPKPNARVKLVGRREIIKKAESCINRPISAAIAAIPPKTPTTTIVHPQVIIPHRPSTSATIADKPMNLATDSKADGSASTRKPSVIIAMSDSDSELSEIDEDIVEEIERKGSFAPLFPGLRAKFDKVAEELAEFRVPANDSEADAGDEDGDEDEGEGQDEPEDNGEEGGGDEDEQDVEMEDEDNDAGDEDQGDADDEDEDDGAGQLLADQAAVVESGRQAEEQRPSTSGFVTVTPGPRRTAPVADSQDPVGIDLTNSDAVPKEDEDMDGNSDY